VAQKEEGDVEHQFHRLDTTLLDFALMTAARFSMCVGCSGCCSYDHQYVAMSVFDGEGLKHLGYADVKHHCASYDHHPATPALVGYIVHADVKHHCASYDHHRATPAGHDAMSVLDGEGLKHLGYADVKHR
jgi:hypothetical protein